MASAAAQVTPAERRVEVQTVSVMAADKKNTWGKQWKGYERERLAQNGT
jgi:hypothetical protein